LYCKTRSPALPERRADDAALKRSVSDRDAHPTIRSL
jgi:hypothetical protein